MDSGEVLGPGVVVGVAGWLAAALLLRALAGRVGVRTAVGVWGGLNAAGLLWLLSLGPPLPVLSGILVVAGFSWIAGRVVIEEP